MDFENTKKIERKNLIIIFLTMVIFVLVFYIVKPVKIPLYLHGTYIAKDNDNPNSNSAMINFDSNNNIYTLYIYGFPTEEIIDSYTETEYENIFLLKLGDNNSIPIDVKDNEFYLTLSGENIYKFEKYSTTLIYIGEPK